MDSVRRFDPITEAIPVVVILLMAIGTVFVFSAGANIGHGVDLNRFYDYPGMRQILFFPLACMVMFTVSRIDYRRFSLEKGWAVNPVVYLLETSIVLLIILLIQKQFGIFPEHIVPEVNKHYRWLQIPLGTISVSFQPSELAKWATIFFIAAYCVKCADQIKLFWRRFVPICLVVGFITGLVIIEDFGTAAFILLMAFIMLLAAGVKFWHILPPLPIAAIALYFAIVSSPMRVQRITAFLHPEKWADSINYQPSQSLIAIGSGGIMGKGLGMGISKYGHLPFDTTDFIFAIIGEEMGFVGTFAVIALFATLLILGMLVVLRCSDPFGRLLAAGIILAITIQAAINIGVVTVVLPTKGIPLPFVSAGGTSMMFSAAAVGVLLNIAKQSSDSYESLDE